MAQQGDTTPLAISWCNTIGTRDGSLNTDAKMVNCFVEQTPNGNALVKRPGTQYTSTVTGVPQGIFVYNDFPYYIVNEGIYLFGSSAPVTLVFNPGAGFLPYMTFDSHSTGVKALLMNFAGALWTFNGSLTVPVSDANYTSYSVQPGIAFLDGVYYVMELGGRVLGSAINDPTTWPALDFVQADAEFGQGVTVSRHLNYIVAYYEFGLQVYYDANSAPNGQGTALGQVSSATFRTGCVSAYTVQEINDVTIFLGQDKAFGRTVQMLNGLTLSTISTPFVEKILGNAALTTDFRTMWASSVRVAGHAFYVLTLTSMNISLAYDITTQNWQVWTSVVGGVEQYFTGRFFEACDTFAIHTRALDSFMQDTSTGRVMAMHEEYYTDATGNINVTAVTPNYDWGTMNWKRFGYMNQFADTVNSTVSVSFSDNDYQTFSTPRTIDLSTVRKQLRNCGSSRRRAWKLQHSANTPLRLYDMQATSTGMQR